MLKDVHDKKYISVVLHLSRSEQEFKICYHSVAGTLECPHEDTGHYTEWNHPLYDHFVIKFRQCKMVEIAVCSNILL